MFVLRSARAIAAAFALALSAGALSLGCGGAEATIKAPSPPPKARNAADIAWDIVHARVGAMIYVDRIRGRPIAAKIESLELFRPFVEGTGLHVETDVNRVFMAAPATNRADETIIVVEHRLPNDRIKSALDLLFATRRLEGSFLDTGGSVPMARVTARGQTRVLALIEPNFLIVLPEAHALEAARFVGTGGFPDPTGREAVLARALDPSNTLRGPRVPPLPPTVTSAVASITLTDDGGADVEATAESTSPEQAPADAAAISQAVEDATTVKIVFVRVRLFKPIVWSAEGAQIKSKVYLSDGEISTLFGALSAILPR